MLNIVKGHINEVFGNQQGLYEKRIKICKECPLFSESKIGYICDSKKKIIKDGKTIKGCGCRLSAKTRLKNEKCILKKW